MYITYLEKKNPLIIYLHIRNTVNNIFFTLTDKKGNVLIRWSGGTTFIKSSRILSYKLLGQKIQEFFLILKEYKYTPIFILTFSSFFRKKVYKAFIEGLQYNFKNWNIKYICVFYNLTHNGSKKAKKRRL